jgi:hypothetical protein
MPQTNSIIEKTIIEAVTGNEAVHNVCLHKNQVGVGIDHSEREGRAHGCFNHLQK